MKLSEMIAMGRTLVPELEAANLDKCALGMAGYAGGLDMVYGRYNALEAEWPWLKEKGQGCECGNMYGLNTKMFDIIHRFDYHIMLLGDWTLDRLIDFVRSIEPAEQAQADQLEALRENEYDHRAGTR